MRRLHGHDVEQYKDPDHENNRSTGNDRAYYYDFSQFVNFSK